MARPGHTGVGWLLLLLVLGGLSSWYAARRPVVDQDNELRLSLGQALGSELKTDFAGFARAERPRPFRFPDDHGPHPNYRTEWWYYTGNLRSTDGRRFGFQLTFFRTALRPPTFRTLRLSAWDTAQVYMAHFSLSDVESGDFHTFQRLSREALNLAGATAVPFRVWLDDWSVKEVGPATNGLPLTVRLRAAQDGVSLDLTLSPDKPVVVHGDNGLSRKGASAGNASYYYSLTRLRSVGVIRVQDRQFEVDGLSWMDREWSTNVLGPDMRGWDWFALQLSNGQELMLYQIRQRSKAARPEHRLSSGTLVHADGTTRVLDADVFRIDALATWRSPRDSTVYPARWRVRIPAYAIDLVVTPLLADQEMDTLIRYWEGAVSVRGRMDGQRVEGHGYVELTGYAESDAGRYGRM